MCYLILLNNHCTRHKGVYDDKFMSFPLEFPFPDGPLPRRSPMDSHCPQFLLFLDVCSCTCSPPFVFTLNRADFPWLYSVLPPAFFILKFCVRTQCFLVFAVAVSCSVAAHILTSSQMAVQALPLSPSSEQGCTRLGAQLWIHLWRWAGV